MRLALQEAEMKKEQYFLQASFREPCEGRSRSCFCVIVGRWISS